MFVRNTIPLQRDISLTSDFNLEIQVRFLVFIKNYVKGGENMIENREKRAIPKMRTQIGTGQTDTGRL